MGYLVLDFHKNGLNNQPVGVIQSTVRFFFGHGYQTFKYMYQINFETKVDFYKTLTFNLFNAYNYQFIILWEGKLLSPSVN